MKYLFVITGKSGAGKDSILNCLVEDKELQLNKVIPFTTRPQREGEIDGKDYRFITDEQFKELRDAGKVLESRSYNHTSGVVHYGTMEDWDMISHNSIMVNTLEGYKSIEKYYKYTNSVTVVPFYIRVNNYERLMRSLSRESNNRSDKGVYEFCRRLISDEEDYSEEKISKLVPEYQIFENVVLESTVSEIKRFIQLCIEGI